VTSTAVSGPAVVDSTVSDWAVKDLAVIGYITDIMLIVCVACFAISRVVLFTSPAAENL